MSGVFDCDIVRELTAADLATLDQNRGVRPSPIRRLTDMHHWIAQLVARGEAGYAIAMATGYSQSRISILKSDPTFQELVARYRPEVTAVQQEFYVNTAAKMAALHNDTIDYLHDRVNEAHQTMDPTFQIRDALDIAKYSADRTGYGPSTKSQNLNLNLDIAGQLEAGRRRGDLLVDRIPEALAAKDAPTDFSGPSEGQSDGPTAGKGHTAGPGADSLRAPLYPRASEASEASVSPRGARTFDLPQEGTE